MLGERPRLLRPPGSVPEARFLDLCVRCGECFKVCPGPVLHPSGLAGGLGALWTPVVVPSVAGCHQDCNYCTQVCPTGAIIPLRIEDKRRFVVGLAAVDTKTCLPHRGESDCDLCYRECVAAGYDAIEMRPIHMEVGPVPEGALSPDEIEQMSTILAPFVKTGACVGCGLCESRCHGAVVRQQKALARSAIIVSPDGAGTRLQG
jgi:Pyruvate/2-oxoacid:ferredoxin oxidoreductase delta subunit